jgi:hypothetical protein
MLQYQAIIQHIVDSAWQVEPLASDGMPWVVYEDVSGTKGEWTGGQYGYV